MFLWYHFVLHSRIFRENELLSSFTIVALHFFSKMIFSQILENSKKNLNVFRTFNKFIFNKK